MNDQSNHARTFLPSLRHARTRGNRRWWLAGAAVAALAGSAVVNALQTRRAEAATPPVGNFVEADGVRLHYLDRGTGTPVVLLHGNGVTLQDWETSGVFDAAVAGHRVLAFDRPGFGYSARPRSTVWTPQAQARVIATALAKLGIGPAVVVGHSWGAMVALAMALDHPEAVAGLVLVSGYYYPTARPDVVTMSPPAVPVIGDLLAHTTAPLTGALIGPAFVAASFAPAPVSPKFARFPIGLTLRPSQVRATAADSALMVPAAIALGKRYADLDVPAVIMAGAGDIIVRPGKNPERLARDLAGSDLRIVPGQGHLLHYAVPEQVVAAIDDVAKRAGAE